MVRTRAPSALLRVVCLTAVLLVSSLACLWPIIDPDAFTHLRSAQFILQHWEFPRIDPFSDRPNPGPYWFYSWAFEIVLYALHQSLGLVGHYVYRVVMSAAIALVIWRAVRRREERLVVAAFLTAATVYSLGGSLFERPWLISICFFVLQLDILLRARSDAEHPGLRWLPLMYVLWANTHIQFIYGLGVLGFFVADSVLSPQRSDWLEPSTVSPKLAARTLLLSGLATLLNPYHFHVYDVVFFYAGDTSAYSYITELGAMRFRDPGDWAVLGLTLAAAVRLGYARRTSVLIVLSLLAGIYLGFRSSRDTWFISVVAGLVLAGPEPAWNRDAFEGFSARDIAAAVGIWLLVALTVAVGRGITPTGLDRAMRAQFPVGAVEHIRSARYRGPLFNHFDWGGYLLFALPEYPPAIDGRTSPLPPGALARSVATWAGGPGWKSDPGLVRAGFVISPKASALNQLLEEDAAFERVYQDDTAAVFLRRGQVSP